MEYILLVTWFTATGQQPNSYQIPFATNGACFQAATELRKEEARLNQQSMFPPQPPPATPGFPTGSFVPARGPMLSAICVVKK